MALTLSQLVEGIAKYEERLTGSAHDKAAFARNIDLLRGRVGSVEKAARALAPVVAEALSSDPSIAIHQILAATGHPDLNPDGTPLVPGPGAESVLGDATPEQARELALLGLFGTPGTNAAVDYSLFEQFYDSTGDGNWAPKPAYATSGTWAAYLANKS